MNPNGYHIDLLGHPSTYPIFRPFYKHTGLMRLLESVHVLQHQGGMPLTCRFATHLEAMRNLSIHHHTARVAHICQICWVPPSPGGERCRKCATRLTCKHISNIQEMCKTYSLQHHALKVRAVIRYWHDK